MATGSFGNLRVGEADTGAAQGGGGLRVAGRLRGVTWAPPVGKEALGDAGAMAMEAAEEVELAMREGSTQALLLLRVLLTTHMFGMGGLVWSEFRFSLA